MNVTGTSTIFKLFSTPTIVNNNANSSFASSLLLEGSVHLSIIFSIFILIIVLSLSVSYYGGWNDGFSWHEARYSQLECITNPLFDYSQIRDFLIWFWYILMI